MYIGDHRTHLKTPKRSALKAPKPAAAEKLPRSMIPLLTKTLSKGRTLSAKIWIVIGQQRSLWVFLVYDTQTSRPFEIGVDDHDLLRVLLFAGLVQDGADCLTKLHSTSSSILTTTHQ